MTSLEFDDERPIETRPKSEFIEPPSAISDLPHPITGQGFGSTDQNPTAEFTRPGPSDLRHPMTGQGFGSTDQNPTAEFTRPGPSDLPHPVDEAPELLAQAKIDEPGEPVSGYDAVTADSDGSIDIDDNLWPDDVEPQSSTGLSEQQRSAGADEPITEDAEPTEVDESPAPTVEVDEPAEPVTESTEPVEPRPRNAVGEPANEIGIVEVTRVRPEALPLLEAAQNLMTPNDREFFKQQSEILIRSKDEARKREAAQEIWTRAATIVAKSITVENQRRALRDGLLQQVNTNVQPERETDDASKTRRWLVDWFMDSLKEILKALAKEALVELLLPGAHLVLPPTGFVDAIFAACKLLEIADAA